MEQLILHLLGDYILQSRWMATQKVSRHWPALVHATVYALPFGLLVWFSHVSLFAWFVIWSTHFIIDRYRLAKYVVWAKNWLGPVTRQETRAEGLRRARELGIVSDAPTFETGELGKFLDWHEKNRMIVSVNLSWRECRATGAPPDDPIWLSMWLLIIADNTIHLAINYLAIRYLGGAA